jgi:hypothetical protein
VPKIITVSALSLALCGVGAARADESQSRFDGVWSTVLSCSAAPGAVPYSYQFSSTVKNSVLHGERGIKDAPGWLQLDGHILPDGSTDISAHGLVGKQRAALGERPPGTPYSYHIDARFSDNSGTGHRVKSRSCTVSFTRTGA